jgi:hypothetical protein
MSEIEKYIQRRVQELLNQNWSEQEIVQQLEAGPRTKDCRGYACSTEVRKVLN